MIEPLHVTSLRFWKFLSVEEIVFQGIPEGARDSMHIMTTANSETDSCSETALAMDAGAQPATCQPGDLFTGP